MSGQGTNVQQPWDTEALRRALEEATAPEHDLFDWARALGGLLRLGAAEEDDTASFARLGAGPLCGEVADRIGQSSLHQAWQLVSDSAHAAEADDAEGDAAIAAEADPEEPREATERFLLERDGHECAFLALGESGALPPESEALLDAAARLGDLDERVLAARHLLLWAKELAANGAAEFAAAGTDPDAWQCWWWTEPARLQQELEAASWTSVAAELSGGAGAAAEGAGAEDKILTFQHLPGVVSALWSEVEADAGALRLAASEASQDPTRALCERLWPFVFEAKPDVHVRASLDETGASLVLLAVDVEGRPTRALAGQRLVLEGAGGAAVTAAFEGVQAILALGTRDLTALAGASLTLVEAG